MIRLPSSASTFVRFGQEQSAQRSKYCLAVVGDSVDELLHVVLEATHGTQAATTDTLRHSHESMALFFP